MKYLNVTNSIKQIWAEKYKVKESLQFEATVPRQMVNRGVDRGTMWGYVWDALNVLR